MESLGVGFERGGLVGGLSLTNALLAEGFTLNTIPRLASTLTVV